MWHVCTLLACAASQPANCLEIVSLDDVTDVRVVASLKSEMVNELVSASNLKTLAREKLQLRLVGDKKRLGPAILGRYRIERGKLIFEPRYGLVPGQTYRAQLLDDGRMWAERDYLVPKRTTAEVATVERICPSTEVLPANCLKFYVYFSKPMREGRDIFDGIYLRDDGGKRIEDVWRRVELWTPDTRRLTLWIHPGRVKQGVNLREQFGPVLEPNRSYTLVIGSELRDADGEQLGKNYTKSFRTTAADYTRPLPQDWRIHAPAAGTHELLVIASDKPLDHALWQRCLTVKTFAGARVAGRVEIASNAATWNFTPDNRWSAHDYTIVVSPLLEDSAGNTPVRRFDTDLTQPLGPPPKLELTFRPRVIDQPTFEE
jgi:hypothetical protein